MRFSLCVLLLFVSVCGTWGVIRRLNEGYYFYKTVPGYYYFETAQMFNIQRLSVSQESNKLRKASATSIFHPLVLSNQKPITCPKGDPANKYNGEGVNTVSKGGTPFYADFLPPKGTRSRDFRLAFTQSDGKYYLYHPKDVQKISSAVGLHFVFGKETNPTYQKWIFESIPKRKGWLVTPYAFYIKVVGVDTSSGIQRLPQEVYLFADENGKLSTTRYKREWTIKPHPYLVYFSRRFNYPATYLENYH